MKQQACSRFVGQVLLALLLAGPAAAQDTGPYALTFDMELPAVSVAYFPDMLAPVVNPAGVGFGRGLEVMFLHQQNLLVEPGQASRPSSAGAEGLFFRSGHLGLGIQWLRPLEQDDGFDYLKYSLTLPVLSVERSFALAGSLEILDPANNDADNSLDFSLGALWRPFRFLSLGLVGRNLGRASLNGVRSRRLLDVGVALRPLWFAPERLTLAADYRMVEGADDPPARFSAWLTLFAGLRLFASADLDGNFGAGLAVDFLHMGSSGYVGVNNGPDGLDAAYLLLAARASNLSGPGLVVGHGRTVRIVLDSSLSAGPQPSRGLFFRRRTSAWQVEQALARAVDDERVDSVLLQVEDPELSWVMVEDLRRQLERLRRAGKKVFVHLRDADNLRYFLACAADAILLNPGGGFMVTGPSVEALFLGGALQMMGVRAEYQRVGDFKTAVDTLTREQPSQAHRQVLDSLADEAADTFFSAVANGRGISRERAQQFIDGGLLTPRQALASKLVDKLVYPDELEDYLAEQLGHRTSMLAGYLHERRSPRRWDRPPQLAVVHASGTIAYRGTPFGGMNAHRIAAILEQLRDDDEVRAVVLRVDSPGGSGAASDLIWRQVVRLRERKPVIVSMGKVAASGGYYISAPADVIVAEPSTITGSIGVFAMFFDLSDLWASLGISKEVVKRSRLADLDSTFRGRTPEEMELIKQNVEAFYKKFVELVARGRHRQPEEIDRIARGRVWTGRQARQRGLVDELGGLSRALEIARQRAGLGSREPVEVVHLPRPGFSLRALLTELGLLPRLDASLLELLDANQRMLLQLATMGGNTPMTVTPLLVRLH